MTDKPDDIGDPREDFFKSKDRHPWSRIKDRILGYYMGPYLAKIVNRGQPILLIDAFAGPGITDDGEQGSPLIMCKAAEQFAPGRYSAIFVNIKQEYHDQLEATLDKAGWLSSAKPILGDGPVLLRSVVPRIKKQSVFLYIDPFGLDCEFDTIQPFLERSKQYSTEIFINLHMPIIHRLAARNAYLTETGRREQIEKWHDKLTRTLGGVYWKDALLLESQIETKEREAMVVKGYMERLSQTDYLTFTGSCPVRARRDSATKYYMIFASPHPDALYVLNDAMCKEFNKYVHEEEVRDTLWHDLPWTEWRDSRKLEEIVIGYTAKHPGKARKELWLDIIRDHFMLFTESEYRKVVDLLVKAGKIKCPTPIGSPVRPTKRLNDNCILEPAPNQSSMF